MINSIGIQESTAIRPVHPAPSIYGRGGFLLDEARKRRSRSEHAPDQTVSSEAGATATDATGLSLRPEEIASSLDSLRRDQSASSHERAYTEAGRRGLMHDGSGAESEKPGPESDQAANSAGAAPNRELSEEEKRQVQELKVRDQEVRTHEQAHLAASGGLAVGGAAYQHERGPDGRMYAVAGEVQIDTSEGENPDDTIDKAGRIRSAALAPAQPSGQDRQVAAQAAQMEASARLEKSSGSGGSGADQTRPAPSLLQRANQAYARTAGGAFSASRGGSLSLAV